MCRLNLTSPRFYYWRTAGGAEVDLIVEHAAHLYPFEIKVHSSPSKKMAQGLLACMNDLKIQKGYIIYPGKDEYSLGNNIYCIPIEKVLLDTNYLKQLFSNE